MRENSRLYQGAEIGLLTLLFPIQKAGKFGQTYMSGEWQVRCQCGAEFPESYSRLYYGTAYSCGCVRKPRNARQVGSAGPEEDYTDQKLGRLHVVQWLPKQGWECVCVDCGAIEVHRPEKLKVVAKSPCTKASETERLWKVRLRSRLFNDFQWVEFTVSATSAKEVERIIHFSLGLEISRA